MTLTTQTLLASSAALLGLLTMVGFGVGGTSFAAGVLLTGLLMLGNLALWRQMCWSARALLLGEAQAAPVVPTFLFVIKFLLLAACLAVLQSVYPVASVVLGASVVVGAILLWAGLASVGRVQLGES